MPETCRNLDQIDRRTLLAGGSLLVAGGLAAKLGSFAWAGAPGFGAFTIASPDALAPGEHVDLVLQGDRLERLAQLCGTWCGPGLWPGAWNRRCGRHDTWCDRHISLNNSAS